MLERLDLPLGNVSNNQHATVEFLLAHYDLDGFRTAYGRQPTLAGAAGRKPEYLERALADLDTSEALYVGDSEKDIVAARRAGIDSVFSVGTTSRTWPSQSNRSLRYQTSGRRLKH